MSKMINRGVSNAIHFLSEIAKVEIYSFMNQNFLGITPNNLDEVLARQNIFERLLMRLNGSFVKAPFNIPQIGVSVDLKEILKHSHEYHNVPM